MISGEDVWFAIHVAIITPFLLLAAVIAILIQMVTVLCVGLKEEVLLNLKRLPLDIAQGLDDRYNTLLFQVQMLKEQIKKDEQDVMNAHNAEFTHWYTVAKLHDEYGRKLAALDNSAQIHTLQQENATLHETISRLVADITRKSERIRSLERTQLYAGWDKKDIAAMEAEIHSLRQALAAQATMEEEIESLRQALGATDLGTLIVTRVLRGRDPVTSLQNAAHLFLGRTLANTPPAAIRREILRKVHTDKSPDATQEINNIRKAITQFVAGLEI